MISPFLFNEKNNIIDDICGNFIGNLSQNVFINNYINNKNQIFLLGDIDNILPLLELMINPISSDNIKYNLIDKSILSEKTFYEFITLIKLIYENNESSILESIKNNFFSCLSIFFSKFPNEVFSERILITLLEISNLIFNYSTPSSILDKEKSNFLTLILLNERIIIKYNNNIGIFWDKIFNFYLNYQEQLKFFPLSSICLILKYYDKNRYNQFCCEEHYSIFFSEDIDKETYKNYIMKPSLKEKIKNLFSILLMIFEHCGNDESSNELIKNEFFNIIKMLCLDISPCLQFSILNLLIKYFSNEQNHHSKKKNLKYYISKNIINIILYVSSISLLNIQSQIIDLIQCWMINYSDVMEILFFNKTNNENLNFLDSLSENLLLKHLFVSINENTKNNFNPEISNFSIIIPKISKKEKEEKEINTNENKKIINFLNPNILNEHKKEIFSKLINWIKNNYHKKNEVNNASKINTFIINILVKFCPECDTEFTLIFLNHIEKYLLDDEKKKEVYQNNKLYYWLIQTLFIFNDQKKDDIKKEEIIEKIFHIFNKIVNVPIKDEKSFKIKVTQIYYINLYILLLKSQNENNIEKINNINNITRKLYIILLNNQDETYIYSIKSAFEFMIIQNNKNEYENNNLDMSLYNDRIPNFIIKQLSLIKNQNDNNLNKYGDFMKEKFAKDLWLDSELFEKIIENHEELTDFSEFIPNDLDESSSNYPKELIAELGFNPKKKNIMINKFINLFNINKKILFEQYSAINLLEIYIILISVNLELTESLYEINFWEKSLKKLIIFSILMSINISKKNEYYENIQEQLYKILSFSIIYLKKRNLNFYTDIIKNYIDPIFQKIIKEKHSYFQKDNIDKSAIISIFTCNIKYEDYGIKDNNLNNATELYSLNDNEINTNTIKSNQSIKSTSDTNIINLPDNILKKNEDIKLSIYTKIDEKNYCVELFKFNSYIKIFKDIYPKEIKNMKNIFYSEILNNEIMKETYLLEKKIIEESVLNHIINFIQYMYKKYCLNYYLSEKKKRNIYKKKKKKLFSWKGLWSDKSLFFEYPENLKFKIKNHYTKEMTKILLVPILDLDYYLPQFRKYNVKNLFLNNQRKYKINLNIDEILNDKNFIIEKIINKNEEENDENENKKNIEEQKEIKEELIYDYNNINFIPNKHGFNFLESVYKNSYSKIWEMYLENLLFKIDFNHINFKEIDFNQLILLNSKFSLEQNKKKYENLYKCCMVKITNHIKGFLQIESRGILFINNLNYNEKENSKDPNFDVEKGTCYGSLFLNRISDKDLIDFLLEYKDIKMILIKNYYYKTTGLEIFTKTRKSYFFNFKSNDDLNKVITDIQHHLDNLTKIIDYDKKTLGYKIYKNKSLTIKKYEEKWINYKISSLEYLMRINLIGNRSYIDLTQYPVFPWLYLDYKEDNYDINCEKKIRPLNTPMGMINIDEESKERSEIYNEVYETTKLTFLENYPNIDYNKFLEEGDKYLEKYKNINNNNNNNNFQLNPLEINQRPYFYGSHYSNPFYVCHYLMRIFPFSQSLIELQGDKFDNPDRLFFSLNQTFINCITQKVDLRELTPEFFYLPEIFNNINQLDFIEGKKEKYPNFHFDVELPKWSNNKAYKVTTLMRNLLEKNDCKINKWIDLIFGVNQKGKKSEEAKNIFQANTYINVVNIEKIDDIDSRNALLGMVEMGMTPLKLFNEDSKKKLSIKEYYSYNNYLNQSKGLELTKGNKLIFIELYSKNYDSLVDLLKDKKIKQNVFPKIEKITCNHCNSLLIYTNCNYYYEMKLNIVEGKININEEKIIKISNLNSHNYNINYKISKINCPPIIINNNEKIYKGGFYNGLIEINILNLKEKKIKYDIYYENNGTPVTYMTKTNNNQLLFCGGKNGVISVYKILKEKIIKIKRIFYHSDEITYIYINDKLNVFASVSYDGFLNILSLGNYDLIRSIKLSNNKTIYANYVFISSSPLPSIIIYILPLKTFKSFTINGSLINEIEEEDNSKEIYSPIIFKNLDFEEFLIYGTDNGYVKIRQFPEMNLIQKIYIKENKAIKCIEISEDRRYCFAWADGNKIIVIKDESVCGSPITDNLTTLGFHL